MAAQLTLQDVNLRFGGVKVLEDVGFDVEPGQILGLVAGLSHSTSNSPTDPSEVMDATIRPEWSKTGALKPLMPGVRLPV